MAQLRSAVVKHPALACILVAGCLFALCLCLELWFPSAKPVWPYPHEDPLGTMGVMVLMVPALTAWGVSIYKRCEDALVRRRYLQIDVLIILWLIDALVKYAAVSDRVVAITWYLYYVPLVFVPLLQLFAALHITTLERRGWVHGVERALVAAGVVLCLLVLTNDVHHLAFAFDPRDPNWDVNYSYGPVYLAVFVWCVALLLSYFIVTVVHARRGLLRAIAFVIVVSAIVVLYCLAYLFRWWAAFNSNFCLSFTVIVVVISETSFDLGLVPFYVGTDRLLRSLPLDIKVLDEENNVGFRSNVASQLDPAVLRHLSKGGAHGQTRFF